MAERAGFGYHPLSGACKPIHKWRRGRDSDIIPFRGPANLSINGGEGGIRTREPLWVTRFPSVRAKPATRPLHSSGANYTRESSARYFGGSPESTGFPLLGLPLPLVLPAGDSTFFFW